jgi:hypothetical protein
MWALMSCKDRSQGLLPYYTNGRASTGYLLHSRVALSIGVVIREPLDPILQDTNLSYVSSLEYIYIYIYIPLHFAYPYIHHLLIENV